MKSITNSIKNSGQFKFIHMIVVGNQFGRVTLPREVETLSILLKRKFEYFGDKRTND